MSRVSFGGDVGRNVNCCCHAGLYESSADAAQQNILATSENPLKKYLTTPKLSEEHLQ